MFLLYRNPATRYNATVPPVRPLPTVGFLLALTAAPTAAQDRWHSWESVAGAALGAASGGIVGSLGSLVPCNDTDAGPHCVRWVAIGAALLGGVGGALLGGSEPPALGDAAMGGAVGLGVGTLVGAGLSPFIQRWAPEDVLAMGLIGGAIGTAPIGAGIGFGGGALVGVTLWWARPGFGATNAAALALGGLAAGVLTDWVVRAASADRGAPLTIGFHVRF